MENLSSRIDTLVIKKWQWVLEAIIAIAKKNGISYTRRELHSLSSDICARFDSGKSIKNCSVQPGQVISTIPLDLKLDIWFTETLPGVAGFVKYTDNMGNTSYALNGKNIPKIRNA